MNYAHSDFLNLSITIPARSESLIRSAFVGYSHPVYWEVQAKLTNVLQTQDWNFTTTPQEGLNNRQILYPRGFVLGGSTAISKLSFEI